MNADRFFTVVGRINALILLVAGLLALVLLGLVVGEDLLSKTDSRPSRDVVVVGDEASEQNPWRFGRFERLSGTGVVWAALRRDEGYGGSFSKDSTVTRNYLFYDLETRSSSWLVEGNDRHFREHEVATVKESDEETGHVVGLLFLVASADTTGDGRVDWRDAHGVAVAAPDGSGFEVLLDGVESFEDFQMYGSDRGFLFYLSSANALRVAEIDLVNLRLLSDSGLTESRG